MIIGFDGSDSNGVIDGRPLVLTLRIPTGADYSNWSVSTVCKMKIFMLFQLEPSRANFSK